MTAVSGSHAIKVTHSKSWDYFVMDEGARFALCIFA